MLQSRRGIPNVLHSRRICCKTSWATLVGHFHIAKGLAQMAVPLASSGQPLDLKSPQRLLVQRQACKRHHFQWTWRQDNIFWTPESYLQALHKSKQLEHPGSPEILEDLFGKQFTADTCLGKSCARLSFCLCDPGLHYNLDTEDVTHNSIWEAGISPLEESFEEGFATNQVW